MTCFGCGETGHQYQNCRHKRHPRQQQRNTANTTWADIIQGKSGPNPQNAGEGETQIPIEMEQDNDPDTEVTTQILTRMTQWHTEESNNQNIQGKQTTRGGNRGTSPDNINTEGKKHDPVTQSETDNTVDETDTRNEIEIVTTTQTINEMEYGKQEEKKDNTPMEMRHENPESDNMPE
jgi:hypothetical protein